MRLNFSRMRRDAFDDLPGCLIIAWIIVAFFWLAFWIGVGYVALHFIQKWW